MTKLFTVGDLVYCPSKGTKLYKLKQCINSVNYPLMIVGGAGITESGRRHMDDWLPYVFHATKVNQRKLQSLYGEEFESKC